jgi:hypothetical protein
MLSAIHLTMPATHAWMASTPTLTAKLLAPLALLDTTASIRLLLILESGILRLAHALFAVMVSGLFKEPRLAPIVQLELRVVVYRLLRLKLPDAPLVLRDVTLLRPALRARFALKVRKELMVLLRVALKPTLALPASMGIGLNLVTRIALRALLVLTPIYLCHKLSVIAKTMLATFALLTSIPHLPSSTRALIVFLVMLPSLLARNPLNAFHKLLLATLAQFTSGVRPPLMVASHVRPVMRACHRSLMAIVIAML